MMKPYSKMKDSGVEWIGEIPDHWKLVHLKRIVDEPLKYGANEAADEEIKTNPRYLRITDFDKSGKLRNDTFKSLPPEVAKDYLLSEGDILFARSGATVGKTFQFKDYKGEACFAGYLIKATTSKKVTSDYLYLYTKTGHYESWKEGIFNQATIQNIGADKYNMLLVPVPPLPEQTRIVAFLDDKTSKIDELIAKKERKIELLKEQRKALINQAVTKGLDPTVPMKDSGVEWIGEIPEHWERAKLKFVTDLINDGTHGSFKRVDDGVRLLSVRNIIDGEFKTRIDDSKISVEDYLSITNSFKVEMNDIQLAIVGATLGKVGLVKEILEPFATQRSVATIRANHNKIDYRYLFYFINSTIFQDYLWLNTGFSAQPGVYLGTLENADIPLPPIQDQLEILEKLESDLNEIDIVIKLESKKMELLNEYRQALISEVVTGKVDVSTYANN